MPKFFINFVKNKSSMLLHFCAETFYIANKYNLDLTELWTYEGMYTTNKKLIYYYIKN